MEIQGSYALFPVPFVVRFFFYQTNRMYGNMETKNEESRIAVIGIVVEQEASVDVLNETLHEYREYIIGRMGIPYREKKVNIISIAIDAPQDKISALSGKIGNLPGIQSKTVYSGVKA